MIDMATDENKSRENGSTEAQNLRIWHGFSTTPKEMTKDVDFGYKFTSIDPNWQLQEMTAMFGPIGDRWSIDTHYETLVIGETAIAICTLGIKYCVSTNQKVPHYVGPVRATAQLVKAGGKVETQAFKIAMTDAMTKVFSLMGMSHTIFQGRFNEGITDDRSPQDIIESVRQNTQGAKDETTLNKISDRLQQYFDSGILTREPYEALIGGVFEARKKLIPDGIGNMDELNKQSSKSRKKLPKPDTLKFTEGTDP